MKIGILSDTHGDVARTSRAVQLLKRHGAEVLLHGGDVGSAAVLAELAASELPVHAVSGNVDLYDDEVLGYPEGSGVRMHGRMADLTLAGRRIGIVHGDDPLLLRRATGGAFDCVITGHTHEKSDERMGSTRVINPGAVYRASIPSVALLDLETDTLTFFALR